MSVRFYYFHCVIPQVICQSCFSNTLAGGYCTIFFFKYLMNSLIVSYPSPSSICISAILFLILGFLCSLNVVLLIFPFLLCLSVLVFSDSGYLFYPLLYLSNFWAWLFFQRLLPLLTVSWQRILFIYIYIYISLFKIISLLKMLFASK